MILSKRSTEQDEEEEDDDEKKGSKGWGTTELMKLWAAQLRWIRCYRWRFTRNTYLLTLTLVLKRPRRFFDVSKGHCTLLYISTYIFKHLVLLFLFNSSHSYSFRYIEREREKKKMMNNRIWLLKEKHSKCTRQFNLLLLPLTLLLFYFQFFFFYIYYVW